MKKIHFKFKNIFFILISVAILSWGIVYTNCGNNLEISENQNVIDSTQKYLSDPSCLATNPTVASAACTIQMIAAGGAHTCAIVNGNVKCWGDNSVGQLGNGTTGGFTNIPTIVPNLYGAKAIYAGRMSTCAIDANDKPVCWGDNTFGQLGNGTVGGFSNVPVFVSNMLGVSEISVGGNHACAIDKNNGITKCWGWNMFGQLGNNTTTNSSIPVKVLNIGTVASISAGVAKTCAIVSSGQAKCWGSNVSGELGAGISSTKSLVPVNVSGLTNTTAIEAGGEYHACAITTAGNLKCWGNNQQGQLGNGSSAPNSNVPVTVINLTNVIAMDIGERHSCAIKSNGQVKCWGENQRGQLGNNTSTPQPTVTPVLVSLLTNATAIEAGGAHTCALENGKMKCWGDNQKGQLGNVVLNISLVPVDVAACEKVIQVGVGNEFTCALTNSGSVYCWGWTYGTLPVQVTGVGGIGFLSGVTSIAVGSHTCALLNTGEVDCWGWNSKGQLGNNTATTSVNNVPVQVHGIGNVGFLSGVTAIAAGGEHSCALLNTGAVNCWGGNDYFSNEGALGDNTTTNSSVPVQVHGVGNVGFLSGVTSISAGIGNTCALLNTGSMNCWGHNSGGTLGDNTTTSSMTPVQVHGVGNVGFLSGVTSISVSGDHTCAVLNTGSLNCWGYNNAGQLGNNNPPNGSQVPIQVHGVGNVGFLSGVGVISAGSTATCAVSTTGSAYCWGSNSSGQSGNATYVDQYTPVQVHGKANVGFLSGVILISAFDGYHSCAVLNTGEVDCWGDNIQGQLGNGTLWNTSAFPTKVQGLP